mmetsp:Transcript_19730/g.60798  ORF Transcript_19730/g.60798 Transcript_19730/m.60798 type:complete len:214 (+) Transcript_19730:222-863(+)
MVHKLLGLLASLCAASTQALVVPRLKLARPRPRTIPNNRRGGVATASVFGEKFETWGLSLKTRGRRQRDLAKDAITPKKVARWGYAVLLYTAFIFYRAYRGTFVVLPAVYGEVFSRVAATAREEHYSIRGIEVADDVDPATGQLRLRSRVLMNLGAMTFMCVLGVARVGKAVVGVLDSTNSPRSPEARLAAREKELDLPPLPDIPDMPPDTDE